MASSAVLIEEPFALGDVLINGRRYHLAPAAAAGTEKEER
jgi:hypothetical protein